MRSIRHALYMYVCLPLTAPSTRSSYRPFSTAAVQSADVVIVVAEALDDHSLVHVISSSTESPVVAVPIDSCPILLPPGVTHVAQNHGLAAALFAARILRYPATCSASLQGMQNMPDFLSMSGGRSNAGT